MRSLALDGLALALLMFPSASGYELKGEHGQWVLGCACKGAKATHGQCGYHFNIFSDDALPWCRSKYNCGNSSIKGSWMYCDERSVERRRGNDNKFYSAKDFKDFYGDDGAKKYADAKPYVERRMAKNNKAYSVAEFRDYYVDALGEQGWVDQWVVAGEETRKADDGKWYTWEEFQKYYNKEGWQKFYAAKSSRNEL